MTEETKLMLIKIILTAVYAVIVLVLLKLNKRFFARLQTKRSDLKLHFFYRVTSAVIIAGGVIIGISFYGDTGSVWKTILGSTAIISAVAAYAAQDSVKDIIAGLMISIYKPFEIGNRVQLEDGTVGIIIDITMRHVLIRGLNTDTTVIPNSKLNAMSLINYSYGASIKSARFDFYIGYGSDVEFAMEVIRKAIEESDLSLPGFRGKDGNEGYSPVYFMAYTDSSLKMSTTVWFGPETASEVLISDINLRVNKALAENNIEIPYAYVNVINHRDAEAG